MSDCRVIQVIETTLTRRGKGIEGDPIRIISEYWSMDGRKLWEVDTYTGEMKQYVTKISEK